jgi:hypothetical protein
VYRELTGAADVKRIMPVRVFLATLVAAVISLTPTLVQAETPHERALRALDQTAKLEFTDTPFKDVFAELSRLHGVPILILREAYDTGHVQPDHPVTRYLKEMSLRSALNLLLDPFKLDYRVTERGEILIFTAQKNAREQRPISKPQAAAAERHRQLLEKKIVTLEFVDTPFKDVIGWLADEVGVSFVLDQEALDAVKIQPDQPVTRNLKDMPLHRALTGFLFEYDLDVELRSEVFLVTKRDPRKPRRPIPEYLKRAAATPVEIELLDPELKDAILECANQANVTIVIDGRVERIDTKVIGPLPKMPLRDALQKMLEPIGLQAKAIDEVLFIVPIKSAK